MEDRADYLTPMEAARAADTTDETIRRWCRRLKIGEHVNGRWCIDPAKLEAVLVARQALGRGV